MRAKSFGWFKEHALWGPNSQILATPAQSFPELTRAFPNPVSTGFANGFQSFWNWNQTDPVHVHGLALRPFTRIRWKLLPKTHLFKALQVFENGGLLFSCELGLRANSSGRSGGGGGKRKESTSLQLFLWNSNICIEKVDAKCWLAEMTLAMTSFLLARVFQWLFTFALVSASRWLTEIWQLSQRGATGELEVEFQFQNSSCKLSFLFPSCR